MYYSGVYAITCKKSKKIYIGRAISIAKRWSSHSIDLRRGCHRNALLQADWIKYGEKNFYVIVLERCSVKSLKRVEQKHLLDNRKRLYNVFVSSKIGGMTGVHTEAFKKRQSKRMMGNQIGLGRRKSKAERLQIAFLMKNNKRALGHKQSPEHIARRIAARIATAEMRGRW